MNTYKWKILTTSTLTLFILVGCATPTTEKLEQAAVIDKDIVITQTADSTLPPDAIIGNGKSPVAEQNLGDFQTQDIYGKPIDSTIFADYQLTMVNVLTTWCSACIDELPDLSELNQQISVDQVQIISIVADTLVDGAIDQEAVELTQTICEKANVQYPMLVPDTTLFAGYLSGIDAYPTTFFVDNAGNTVGHQYLGNRSYDGWQKIINDELESYRSGGTANVTTP